MRPTEGRIIPEDIPPIMYRGTEYYGEKVYFAGTHRSRTPHQTLASVEPLLSTAGVTRLADITGLDRINIPTILSIRPNAKTLTVTSGKGFTVEAARASAAMEAIELFHAETVVLPSVRASYEEIRRKHVTIAKAQLPLTKHSLFTETWPYYWSFGWDVLSQTEVATPLFIVNMAHDSRRVEELGAFQVSSNGLASGNNFAEALIAGILEVLERDAVALWHAAWHRIGAAPPLINQDSIQDDRVGALILRLERAEFGTVLFDCRVDTDVAVFQAFIYDRRARHSGVYKGYGAHFDAGIAAIRAITEAVQSRVIYIAGSRDDMFRQQYFVMKHTNNTIVVDELVRLSSNRQWSDVKSETTNSFHADFASVSRKAIKAGLEQIIVHDLTLPGWPISVLKVIIPGAEGYMFDWYTPGPRAKRFVEERR
jgi:ribosomal protein S12 methylthiotransferase accessory factor